MILALMAHGLALVAPFQFDDQHQIALNPAMKDPASIPRFFFDPWIGSSLGFLRFYRPVLFVTFVVDSVVGGGSPLPFRITSLALLVVFALVARRFVHRVLPLLVPGVSERRTETAATGTAVLVVVHPLLNESILLATGRSSLLMAVFGLGALTLLAAPRVTVGRALAAVGLTVLALLTKETAVVLAPLALGVTWLCRVPEVRTGRRLAAAWPIVLPVALYASFFLALPYLPDPFPERPEFGPPSQANVVAWSDRPSQAAVALVGLARLLAVPWGLSLVHEVPPPTGWAKPAAYLLWPALAVAIVALWRRGGAGRLVGAALLWFAGALTPILAAGLNTPMGEHRVALAVVLPLAAAAYALASIEPPGRRKVAAAAVVAALVLLASLQTWPWRSALELWRHELEIDPQNARAWAFLADAQATRGDSDGAVRSMERAMALAPDVPTLIGKAAVIEWKRGHLDRAARLASRVVALDDSFAEMHLILAEHLAVGGRLAAALVHARRAVELDPGSSPAWNAVGNVLLMQGSPGAVDAYRKALELAPGNREAAANLEQALGLAGSRAD